MHGMRHCRSAPAGRSLLLVSLFALLAFTCFPVFAQAEGSSGLQYETEPLPKEHHQQQKEPVANTSNNGGGTPSAPADSNETPSSEVGSGGGTSSEAVEGGSGNGSEPHQTSPEAGQGKHNENVAPSHATTPAKPESQGGGSSPLVPILIALVALAAISIGVFVMRQRRGGSSGGGKLSAPRAG
jgi:cobalamin biosynthesis Mg chelatase CobN